MRGTESGRRRISISSFNDRGVFMYSSAYLLPRWSTACPDQMLDSTYLWHQNSMFSDLNSNFDCSLPWHIQILEHTHYSPQQWYCLYWDPCAPTQPETTEWGLGKCWSAHAVSSQWKYLVTFENIVDSLKSLVNQWNIMQGIANLSIDQVILCIDAKDDVLGLGLLVHHEKCWSQSMSF